MPGEVRTFSFKDLAVLVGGIALRGFADGDEVVTVERNEDAYRLLIGADGDAAALKNANQSGVAMVKLLQVSPSNAYLSSLIRIQDAGILSPVPFIVRDPNGADTVLAQGAFPQRPPRLGWGQGHSPREWRFALASVDIFAGGVLT